MSEYESRTHLKKKLGIVLLKHTNNHCSSNIFFRNHRILIITNSTGVPGCRSHLNLPATRLNYTNQYTIAMRITITYNYTTKGAASLKSVLKIGPISTHTVSIRHQSSRKFFYAYILPVRELWTARFLRLSFVFTTKIIIKFATFCDTVFCYVVLTLIASWRHRRLLKTTHNCARHRTTTHDYAQLSTMVNFIVLSITFVFMALGVSYSRVLAQRPTGCCSAS